MTEMAVKFLGNKLFIAIAAVAAAAIALSVAASIERRRPVDYISVPETARDFIEEHYPGKTPALSVKDIDDLCTEYEISFTDGTKVKFNRKGEWTKIESRSGAVPRELVPDAVLDYTERNFPGCYVIEISRDRKETEVRLDNRIELTFDSRSWVLRELDD